MEILEGAAPCDCLERAYVLNNSRTQTRFIMQHITNQHFVKGSFPLLPVILALVLGNQHLSAQSLKAIPTTEEMLEVLENPLGPLDPRIPFPGLTPLPELAIHDLYTNTITVQPLLLTNPPFEINYDIPATGTSPFIGGVPDRAFELPLTERDFIIDKNAAIQLGKALFWDMQGGSDGIQACGTCHFHAGADNRTRNQLNPGTFAGDSVLDSGPKNQPVNIGDFPFHKLQDPNVAGEPLLNPGNVLADSNDVLSSMGVRWREFQDIETPGAGAFIAGTVPAVLKPDIGVADPDPVGDAFQDVRRVEPRNTPTFHGSTGNFDNFWVVMKLITLCLTGNLFCGDVAQWQVAT